MANYFEVTSRLLGDPEAYRLAADNVRAANDLGKEPEYWRIKTEIMAVSKAILDFRELCQTDDEALMAYRQDRGLNLFVVAEYNPGQVQQEVDALRFIYRGMFRIAEIALRVRAQMVKEKRGWLLQAPVNDN